MAQKAPARACLLIPLLAHGASGTTAAAEVDPQEDTVLLQLDTDAAVSDLGRVDSPQASDYCYYVSGTCYLWSSPCSGGCCGTPSDFSLYSSFCPEGIRYATEAEWSVAEPVLIANKADFHSKCAASVLDSVCPHCDEDNPLVRIPDDSANELVLVCGEEAPTPATPDVVSGTGDPHLSNIHGEHFDIYQTGSMALLRLPRLAEPARTMLLVEADARRVGDVCSVYFEVVTISGVWTNQTEPIQFLASTHSPPEGRHWKEWMHFGPIDLKVARRNKGVDYLNVYARNIGHSGYEVGGLLGLDDHTAVAKRPPQCSHRHAAALFSVAEAK